MYCLQAWLLLLEITFTVFLFWPLWVLEGVAITHAASWLYMNPFLYQKFKLCLNLLQLPPWNCTSGSCVTSLLPPPSFTTSSTSGISLASTTASHKPFLRDLTLPVSLYVSGEMNVWGCSMTGWQQTRTTPSCLTTSVSYCSNISVDMQRYIYIYVYSYVCVDIFSGIHMHCISTHILENESQSLSEIFSPDANYYQEAKMSENFSCTSLVLHRYGFLAIFR